MNSTSKNNYIPSLNGLRGLSIIMVIIDHVSGWCFKADPEKNWFLVNGVLGVHVFFVISGFLITKLLLEEEELRGTVSLKSFYIRRSLRIFPAFYFLLFCYFIMQCFGVIHMCLTSWITSITYTKYFPIPNGSDFISSHFWSLSVEEHFYLLWPLVFKYLKQYRKIVAWVVIVIVTFLRYIYTIKQYDLLSQHGFFQSIDVLMVGCIFAMYEIPIFVFLDKLMSINRLFIYLPIVLFILLRFANELVINQISISGLFLLRQVPIVLHFNPFLVFGIYGIGGSIIIALIVVMASRYSNNLWYKLLNTSVLGYIGLISYSLYLWQQCFVTDELKFFSRFPFNIFFMLIVASFSYRFIEKPFLRMKSKFLRI